MFHELACVSARVLAHLLPGATVCPLLVSSWSCPVESSSQGAHKAPSPAQASHPRGLPCLSTRLSCLVSWKASACCCESLVRGEKPTRSSQASEHGRLRLSQSAVRVLRQHRGAHPRAGWRWQAWPGRADPDLPLSVLPHHLHFQAQYPLYRLKTPFQKVAMVLSALAEGLDASAAERIFGYRQATVTTWLSQAGEHVQTLTSAASATCISRSPNSVPSHLPPSASRIGKHSISLSRIFSQRVWASQLK